METLKFKNKTQISDHFSVIFINISHAFLRSTSINLRVSFCYICLLNIYYLLLVVSYLLLLSNDSGSTLVFFKQITCSIDLSKLVGCMKRVSRV